ncbi:LacI family DNA-binding transcriptional regulator [Neorhizobium vignae]|uniref:LacI family DNA-binding transcriptional regulator n=1 Tax=Neorhizobium vignae TaxID=690585 RepID=UPI00055C870D|nr:LacI family DNA-binding transcriptional regulator [Neorhizobium vignae]
MADEREPRNPTLVDVAKAADVSVSTAARVLRKSGYPVDIKLKEKVDAAAKSLGYVPNLVARRLRGGKQGVVGLVIGDMLDAHYGMIAETVTQRAETAHSTFAMVCNMQRDPLLEIKYLRKLLEYRVDGIILAGGGFDQWTHHEALAETVEELKRAGTIITSLMPRNIEVPVFSADNEAIGLTKAQFIVQNGHTKIGILLGPARNQMTKLRMQAMTSHLSGCSVDYAIANIESTPEAGALGAAEMLTRNPDFTALICGSDAIAFGAINHLRAEGIDIPGRISVMGLGNTRLATLCTPALTTVEMNFDQAGRAALDFIASHDPSAAHAPGEVIPHSLVLRESFSRLDGVVPQDMAPFGARENAQS